MKSENHMKKYWATFSADERSARLQKVAKIRWEHSTEKERKAVGAMLTKSRQKI